jgi:hypothetical protein
MEFKGKLILKEVSQQVLYILLKYYIYTDCLKAGRR